MPDHDHLRALADNPALIDSEDELDQLIDHAESCPDCSAVLNQSVAFLGAVGESLASLGPHLSVLTMARLRLTGFRPGTDACTQLEKWHLTCCPDCRARYGSASMVQGFLSVWRWAFVGLILTIVGTVIVQYALRHPKDVTDRTSKDSGSIRPSVPQEPISGSNDPPVTEGDSAASQQPHRPRSLRHGILAQHTGQYVTQTQPGVTPTDKNQIYAGVVSPFSPDIQIVPSTRKRRVVIAAFDSAAIQDRAQSYLKTTDDVGQSLRTVLVSQLRQSNVITVLERNAATEMESKRELSSGTDRSSSAPRIGHILGADYIVTGNITIFGRDDKTTWSGFGGRLIAGSKGGAIGKSRVTEKAVVGIEFRIVDSVTSEVLVAGSVRGESIRKNKSLGAEGVGITSSGFEKTLLGEAMTDAVSQIVKKLEEQIPQLPVKPRSIEGRVSQISTDGVYLALGSNDGVLPGDHFEIRQINSEVLDPQTKELIDVEEVKVGELVVREVSSISAIGTYSGQLLSPTQLTGKGYVARLISK